MEKITLPIDEEKGDLVTPSNPDFSWMWKMLFISVIVIIFVYFSILAFSYLVITYLPIEKEKEIFGSFTNYLENLEEFDVTQLNSNFEYDNKYNIYVYDSPEVNAFATLGGTIILNRGLLENIKYEEELLFIIGHELNHIENRDVLKSISKDIPFTFALKLLGFDIDLKITSLSEITKSYSDKKAEIESDNAGAKLINDLGLNLECSLNFFRSENQKFIDYLDFIASHPNNQKRIKNLELQNQNSGKECSVFNYNLD